RDSPHLTRNFGALPPAMLFAGVGATRLLAQLRAVLSERLAGGVAPRLAVRFAVPACAVAAMVYATLFNAYEYFIARQNEPDVDQHMNQRARQLCETVRHAMPIHFYYTYDLEYWCSAQCVFLASGAFPPKSRILHAEDLA